MKRQVKTANEHLWYIASTLSAICVMLVCVVVLLAAILLEIS